MKRMSRNKKTENLHGHSCDIIICLKMRREIRRREVVSVIVLLDENLLNTYFQS